MKKPDKKFSWIEAAKWGAIVLAFILIIAMMISGGGGHGHEH